MADPEARATDRTSWQSVRDHLFYPVLVAAVIGASPAISNLGWQVANDTYQVTWKEARQQHRFFERNGDCLQAPEIWVEVAEGTALDGTICEKTGDVLLRIQEGERKRLKGFLSEDFMRSRSAASLLPGLASAAAASTAEMPSSGPFTPIPAQQLAITLCQTWEDDRYFIRHVRVGNACYDERYDSFTGERLSQRPVSCRGSC